MEPIKGVKKFVKNNHVKNNCSSDMGLSSAVTAWASVHHFRNEKETGQS